MVLKQNQNNRLIEYTISLDLVQWLISVYVKFIAIPYRFFPFLREWLCISSTKVQLELGWSSNRWRRKIWNFRKFASNVGSSYNYCRMWLIGVEYFRKMHPLKHIYWYKLPNCFLNARRWQCQPMVELVLPEEVAMLLLIRFSCIRRTPPPDCTNKLDRFRNAPQLFLFVARWESLSMVKLWLLVHHLVISTTILSCRLGVWFMWAAVGKDSRNTNILFNPPTFSAFAACRSTSFNTKNTKLWVHSFTVVTGNLVFVVLSYGLQRLPCSALRT